jgi:glycosyltransferase involved in cell wall biosynthesis
MIDTNINYDNLNGRAIPSEMMDWILNNVPKGSTILELGSGNGTKELVKNYKVYSVEHDENWINIAPESTYIHAPIVDNWYDVNVLKEQLPTDYDLLIIDGPIRLMRINFLKNYHLFRNDVTILIDDTNRPDDKKMALNLTNILNKKHIEIKSSNKNFMILYGTTEVVEDKDLSIIIPTFDVVEYIDECLESILNSVKNLNCEILVGIDGCQKTLNHVKDKIYDERIVFTFFDKNGGPYIIKNSLSKIAKSKNILFFDSDDIMNENMVSDIHNKLNNNIFIKPMYFNFKTGEDYKLIKATKGNGYGEGVFAIKKNIFLSMNGFEPWRCAADSDFMVRLYKNKHKFSYTTEVSFLRRVHSKSLTAKPETNFSSSLRNHYMRMFKGKKEYGPLNKLNTQNFIFIKDNSEYIFYDDAVSVNYDTTEDEKPKSIIDTIMSKHGSTPKTQTVYTPIVKRNTHFTPEHVNIKSAMRGREGKYKF